ncbi:MAG: hypothetical protein MJY56_03850 [Bacteroidales bacterium]|nr:hypothetical protein [Bacteroidales bacterium]
MKRLLALLCSLAIACLMYGENVNFNVEWNSAPGKVSVSARNGGDVTVKKVGKLRRACVVSDALTASGPGATVVRVDAISGSFSFFLRDVPSESPIWIPEYGVVVLPGDDGRSYDEVVGAIEARGLVSKLDAIEAAPEMSFEEALSDARDMYCPIWLGIGRDMRKFEVIEEKTSIEDFAQTDKRVTPRRAFSTFTDPLASPERPLTYDYSFGRGMGPKECMKRSLEDNVLPIYHSETVDDELVYHTVSLVSFEKSELKMENIAGSDYMITDSYCPGRYFTPSQRTRLEEAFANAPVPDEEVVMYIHTTIENTASVPRYAFFKVPYAIFVGNKFDPETGMSYFPDGRVFCVSLIDGKPAANEEMTVLMKPGETIKVDYYLTHSPISRERAEVLAARSYDEVYAGCKAFWRTKLDSAAKIRVPEERIQDMIERGLLHFDLVTYGYEPDGALAANCGVYSPIGTESAPIIQYYESLGWLDQARRCLEYFLETQQEDGRIVNFFGYTIETGAVLWSVGEYYRYTHDVEWLREVKPALLKTCRYLMDWRAESMKPGNIGHGYGMVSGKVADPEDQFHQFMLNAYSWLGMDRMAEVFEAIGAAEAGEIRAVSDEWKGNILDAFRESLASSPVVPLTDGSWCPTCAPWAEMAQSRFFYQVPENYRSHGTFTTADCLLGPLHLMYAGLVAPDSVEGGMLLKYHRDLFFQGNSAFSQPYYSKHNTIQARLGMVKPFLDTYYNTVASHFDHETGTFWEHYFRLSPHKTHEEANFLMETRGMLWQEDGDTLYLFRVIPRAWMEDGKEIVLDGVRSYFGELSVRMTSKGGRIEAEIDCSSEYKPGTVIIRMPHPDGLKPASVSGGQYDAEKETVEIRDFNGHSTVSLIF